MFQTANQYIYIGLYIYRIVDMQSLPSTQVIPNQVWVNQTNFAKNHHLGHQSSATGALRLCAQEKVPFSASRLGDLWEPGDPNGNQRGAPVG